MRRSHYDIHGLRMTLEVAAGARRSRLLSGKWSAFETETPTPSADITMRIGPFRAEPPAESVIIDKDFHVAPEYVYFGGYRGRGRTEIRGWESGCVVIRHNPYHEAGAHKLMPGAKGMEMYLLPMLKYLFSKRGDFLLHGGGIARDGMGVILFGSNGSGKTALVLHACLRHGWAFLGDDLVLLRDGRALCVPEQPRVLHARAVRVSAGKDVRLGVHALAKLVLRTGPETTPSSELVIAEQAEVVGVVLIEREPLGGEPKFRPCDRDHVWAASQALEQLELSRHQRRHRQLAPISRMMMAYEYRYPGSDIFANMLGEYAPLPPALGKVRGCRGRIPDASPNTCDALLSCVERVFADG